jgi:hypothetical protein
MALPTPMECRPAPLSRPIGQTACGPCKQGQQTLPLFGAAQQEIRGLWLTRAKCALVLYPPASVHCLIEAIYNARSDVNRCKVPIFQV